MTVTKSAADVVEAGDVLSIYEVGYSVMSVPSDTTIVLTTPYAGETNAAVPAGDVKLRNKCDGGECCSHEATCGSWPGVCPVGKQRREAHDMHVCKDNICNEAECCQTKCSDWPGVCPTGEYKSHEVKSCGDKHFTEPISVTNNDAIVTKAAADVVEAGDVLSIYDVDYSVMSITGPTTIVLTTPYFRETNAAVPALEVKLRNRCNADECCRAGAFCSEWSAP